ncbi:stage V sporulation protein AF [Amphibacillus marinus]|uniref:Stage V sporulation protein AF n=1 Tax=Amphibacillus marinus TaxID=872970 RepID=A0A1H8HFK6_9BACI|nr:spore germination protein [Amphibacillus marinus]SEN54845.1 stage V sporulation protein AF [Amphibacillus marinus]
MKTVKRDYQNRINYLSNELAVDESFDLVKLELDYADREMCIFLVDGFVKDEVLMFLLHFLSELTADQLEQNGFEKLMKSYIPYAEIAAEPDLDKIIDQVLSGPAALIIEGFTQAILIDTRTYPARGPEEPDLERVVRGSRDGYVETIVFNTALTRRRVRDRSLRMVYMQIGKRSKSDVCLCYLSDIADPGKVKLIEDHLKAIEVDGLPMAEKTIEEFLAGQYWNPYPVIRYTERPDTAAAHLYEGHIILIVDASPSVMIMPATFWHHLEHAEEYRQKPSVGAYLRGVRFIAVLAALFLLPFYYLLSVNPSLIPAELAFLGPEDSGSVPLVAQFLLAEIGLDVLRMAAIHTPSALATALGLVAAIMIGDVAVEVGLFSSEVVLYISIAAMGTFCTPSYEMSLANRLTRIYLLISTALFGVAGYVAGITLWLLLLIQMKTFKTGYLWPFIPFSFKALLNVWIRMPIPFKKYRPSFLDPQDPKR